MGCNGIHTWNCTRNQQPKLLTGIIVCLLWHEGGLWSDCSFSFITFPHMGVELHARALSSWLEREGLASKLTWPHRAVRHQAKSFTLSGCSVAFKIREEGNDQESSWAFYFPVIDMWQSWVQWLWTHLLPQHSCQNPPFIFTSQFRW